jgi:RNA-binding protein Musashi
MSSWSTIQQAMAAGDREAIREILQKQAKKEQGRGSAENVQPAQPVSDGWQTQSPRHHNNQQRRQRGRNDQASNGHDSGTVFVGGIASGTDDNELANFLRNEFGDLTSCKIVRDRDGRPKQFGFVTFRDPRVAAKAKSLKQVNFKGKV